MGISQNSLASDIFNLFYGYWCCLLDVGISWKIQSLIEGVFVSPLILPPTVVGFLLLLLFGKNGFIGKLIEPFNISIVFQTS